MKTKDLKTPLLHPLIIKAQNHKIKCRVLKRKVISSRKNFQNNHGKNKMLKKRLRINISNYFLNKNNKGKSN
jgi:hypothetical protein